eukprot:gene7268-8656_t
MVAVPFGAGVALIAHLQSVRRQGNVQDTASPFQEVSAPHGAVAAPSDRLQAALCTLNIKLPADVRVHSAKVAPAGFDANQDATGKVYHYHIASEQRPDPWDAPFRCVPRSLGHRCIARKWISVRIKASLNVEAMQAVAALLQSRQDFTALSDPRKRGEKADNIPRPCFEVVRVLFSPKDSHGEAERMDEGVGYFWGQVTC